MKESSFNVLVSPKTGVPLHEIDGKLTTPDGKEYFTIQQGIANLLDFNNLDSSKQNEIDVFDNIDIHNVPYFRMVLYKNVMAKISSHLKKKSMELGKSFRIVELGGGEGHWANYIKREYSNAEVFVCDLSFNTLQRAPDNLRRVCADVTRPIFRKSSIHLASFWVSLHHLGKDLMGKALKEVADFLDKDGILIVFEPNNKFLPRQIMYRSRLSKDVYFDEKEQAVDFSELSGIAKNFGLEEVETCFINPPYNIDFIKKLKHWYIYMPMIEIIYQTDKWIFRLLFDSLFSDKLKAFRQYLTLYGVGIYSKNPYQFYN